MKLFLLGAICGSIGTFMILFLICSLIVGKDK